MFRSITFAVVLATLVFASLGQEWSKPFPYSMEVDPQDYYFYWDFNSTTFRAGVVARGRWAGVGCSLANETGMAASDYAIYWTNGTIGSLADYYTEAGAPGGHPTKDEVQNLVLLDGHGFNDTHVFFEFTRPLDSQDAQDCLIPVFTAGGRLLFALSTEDQAGRTETTLTQHSFAKSEALPATGLCQGCTVPAEVAGLQNLTTLAQTITIRWNAYTTAAERGNTYVIRYTLEWRVAGTTTWNPVDIALTEGAEFYLATLNQLQPDTEYEFRVVGVNGIGSSTPVGISVRTNPLPLDTPLAPIGANPPNSAESIVASAAIALAATTAALLL